MDPCQTEVGKLYKLISYMGEGVSTDFYVVVTEVTNSGCYATPNIATVGPPLYYSSPWNKFEEVQIEMSQTNYIEKNSCPECRIPGEFVNFAWKCPRCWKRW